MNSAPRAHLPRVDVAGSTPATLEALRRRSEVEGFELVEWPSYEALANALACEPALPRRLLLCPMCLDEISAGWIRRVRRRRASTAVVILAGQGDTDRAHQLQLEGATAVYNAPLPPSPVDTWYSSRDYLATLYRDARTIDRWESHYLRLASDRRWIPSVIRLLCDRFDQFGWSDEMVRSILPLVIDEVVSNAMGHGNGWDHRREVELRAYIGPTGYRIEVQDQGAGFIREEVRDPVDDENREREGGRGLFLMERLVDTVRYEDGGRRVVLQGGEPPRPEARDEPIGELVIVED